MFTTRRQRRGATVIELAVCIMILGAALPTLIKAFAEGAAQTLHPANAAVAYFLATERMEEVVSRRYRGTDGYSAVTAANFPDETPVAGFPAFSRSVTVTFVDPTLATVGSDQGYKRVRVTVAWDGGARSTFVERVFGSF